jgi:hypothetical protein
MNVYSIFLIFISSSPCIAQVGGIPSQTASPSIRGSQTSNPVFGDEQTASPSFSDIQTLSPSSLQTSDPTFAGVQTQVPASDLGQTSCVTEYDTHIACVSTPGVSKIDNDACDACLESKVDYRATGTDLQTASCDELGDFILREANKCHDICFPPSNQCSASFLALTECFFKDTFARDRCGSGGDSGVDGGSSGEDGGDDNGVDGGKDNFLGNNGNEGVDDGGKDGFFGNGSDKDKGNDSEKSSATALAALTTVFAGMLTTASALLF